MAGKATLRDKVLVYVKKEYGIEPQPLWRSYPMYEVLSHETGRGSGREHWFGIIMEVSADKVGIEREGHVHILNVRCDPEAAEFLRMSRGYLPAYRMNAKDWISVVLDGTVPMEGIKLLIDESFAVSASGEAKKKVRRTGHRDFIIPSNPRDFDIFAEWQETSEITWHQDGHVQKGDYVYIYVAAPYSAIMFRTVVAESDIPPFEKEHYPDKPRMRLRLEYSYDREDMPITRMKPEFGVFPVRGFRGMPHSLRAELDYIEGIIQK